MFEQVETRNVISVDRRVTPHVGIRRVAHLRASCNCQHGTDPIFLKHLLILRSFDVPEVDSTTTFGVTARLHDAVHGSHS